MNPHHVGTVAQNLESCGHAYANALRLVQDAGTLHRPAKNVGVSFCRDETSNRDAVSGGAILAVSPVPAVAFSGRRFAFLYFPKVGLIELVEREAGP
jgi:hypothetical protein